MSGPVLSYAPCQVVSALPVYASAEAQAPSALLPLFQGYGGYGPEELAALLAAEAGAAVEERRKEALDILEKVRGSWMKQCTIPVAR